MKQSKRSGSFEEASRRREGEVEFGFELFITFALGKAIVAAFTFSLFVSRGAFESVDFDTLATSTRRSSGDEEKKERKVGGVFSCSVRKRLHKRFLPFLPLLPPVQRTPLYLSRRFAPERLGAIALRFVASLFLSASVERVAVRRPAGADDLQS